jgi:DNA-directed RNA polymerase subunit N (RpoN/RPB10)
MVCHILCPHCANDLADVFPFFKAVQKGFNIALIKQETTKSGIIDIEKLFLKTDVSTDFAFICDALYLNNLCCRSHILTQVDFDSDNY